MTSFTDPCELFREITDMHALLGEIVSSDTVQLAMMRRFAGQCRIEDLMHPSSM